MGAGPVEGTAKISGARAKELDRLRDEFVDAEELARFYVEPLCQDRNPADERFQKSKICLNVNLFAEFIFRVVGLQALLVLGICSAIL